MTPIRQPRTIAWILTLVSLLAFIGCALGMGVRAARFNREADFQRYRIEPTLARTLEVHGRPATLTDALDDQGRSLLMLTYGDAVQAIPVKDPPARDVPELVGYLEWVSVQAITPVQRDGSREVDASGAPVPSRYVIVTRHTAAGFDPESWGSVRRADWTFSFYELRPDGTISHDVFRFPRSRRGEQSLAKRAAAADAKPHEIELAAIPPLKERTWQYQAALHVIPKLHVPKYRFEDDAFSFRTMGWYLPGAGFAALGVLIGLGLAFAPQRPAAVA